MGIANWFVNDLTTKERALTRDLLSIAIADNKFREEEQNAILEICKSEGISEVEMMDSIRHSKDGVKILQSHEDKKKYLTHLIKVMSVDENYSSIEMHVIEIIAKEIGISRMKLISFVLDEIEVFGQEKGITIVNHFVKYFTKTGS